MDKREALRADVMDEMLHRWQSLREPLPLSYMARFSRTLHGLGVTSRAFVREMQADGLCVVARDLSQAWWMYPREAWEEMDEGTRQAAMDGLGPGMPTQFKKPGRPRKQVIESIKTHDDGSLAPGIDAPVTLGMTQPRRGSDVMREALAKMQGTGAKAAAGDDAGGGAD